MRYFNAGDGTRNPMAKHALTNEAQENLAPKVISTVVPKCMTQEGNLFHSHGGWPAPHLSFRAVRSKPAMTFAKLKAEVLPANRKINGNAFLRIIGVHTFESTL